MEAEELNPEQNIIILEGLKLASSKESMKDLCGFVVSLLQQKEVAAYLDIAKAKRHAANYTG